MLNVISAVYGGLNVAEIVKNYIKDDVLNICAGNHVFGDPQVGVCKTLDLILEYDGEIIETYANEGETFIFPKQKHSGVNTLILTSCNRIEQILFAIAVNKEIIKNEFNLIVADCSTPNLKCEEGVALHQSDDPYNLINKSNYNSDWTLIEKYVKTIPKIKEFSIIHIEPRMTKQMGEANLITLGLSQTVLLGSKNFIKLTGVCHLKYDIFNKFKDLGEEEIVTWRRSGFGNQISSRVFGGRSEKVSVALINAGWSDWLLDHDFIERRMERVIKKYISPDFIPPELDERDIIVDEGIGRHDHRDILMKNLKNHNLLESNDPWILKFLNGEIWE